MKTIQLDYNDLFIVSLFTVVGNSVVIKAANGDVLYTLPTALGITTEESDGVSITFTSGNYYFVITGFPSTAQRDLDNDILVAACNVGSSGAGGATAANQVLEIAELTAIKGNQTNGTQVIALPTGASTSANQATTNASLTNITNNQVTELAAINGIRTNQTNGTQVTTVSSSALPSGASTSANQVTSNTKLDSIITNTESRGAVTTVLVAVTTTSAVVLVANANRKSLLIWNNSGGVIRIGIGATALAASGLRIPANNGFSFDYVPTDAIHIRTESGVNNVNLIWS